MSKPNKFSSHKAVSPKGMEEELKIREDKTLREAEDMLRSPNLDNQEVKSPKPEEIDKMIHSQSLSVVFQDLNESEMAKFNKKGLDSIAEVQWNDQKGPLSSDRIRNLDVPLNDGREKPYDDLTSSIQNVEKSAIQTEEGVKTYAVTPQKNSGIKSNLGLQLKPSISKNNSVASYSDRSHLKLASSSQDKQIVALEKSEVKKDKLFSEDDPHINSSEYQIGEGNNNQNDWSYNALKPGVDQSEFYNPYIQEDPHNISTSQQPIPEGMLKQTSEARLTDDRLQGGVEEVNTVLTQTATFQKKMSEQRQTIGENENSDEIVDNRAFATKAAENHQNEFDNQVTQNQKIREMTYGEVEDSNEDIDHAG